MILFKRSAEHDIMLSVSWGRDSRSAQQATVHYITVEYSA